MPPTTDQWMCNLCFPNHQEIGMITDGYSLIRDNNGDYYILGGNGHALDEVLHFDIVPWVDPDPLGSENLTEEQEEEADRWLNEADTLYNKLTMPADEGYAFIHSCIETGGYREDENHPLFHFWLFNKCGELIEKFNSNNPDNPIIIG